MKCAKMIKEHIYILVFINIFDRLSLDNRLETFLGTMQSPETFWSPSELQRTAHLDPLGSVMNRGTR